MGRVLLLAKDPDPMGLMRFAVASPEQITDEAIRQAYMSGVDRTAWLAQADFADGELTLRRKVSDSGNLCIPWQVEGHGRLTLSTGCLCEQFGPYRLPLELARGAIGQLRNQLAEWQAIGLTVPPTLADTIRQSLHCFGRAAVGAADPQAHSPATSDLAQRALRLALDAGELLAAAYVDQSLAVRRRGGAKLPTLLGVHLGSSLLDDSTARQVLVSFNAGLAPACWRDIEASEGIYDWDICDKQIDWCRTHGLTVCAGPLLKLDPSGLPDWLYLWEGDGEDVASFAAEFLRATVERYRGKVDFWQCAGRFASDNVLELSEEEKLRLVAHTVSLTHSLDSNTPVVISFDQPWAEYMGRRAVDFPPLHFADALVRAGLELGGLMLEINLGYSPDGTMPRTSLEFSRQLDYWASLGLPLLISLTAPSAGDADPLARSTASVLPGSWTPAAQQQWVARCVPLLLSKPYVQGIFWNQLSDSQPHDFPHGGLIDMQGRAKPALHTLTALRQGCLR